MYYWYGDGHMGWMGIVWGLGLLVAVVLIWMMLRSTHRPGGGAGPSESAEDVLKRRYAKGEIDRDTYQQMLRDIRGEG
jgi:putative membrane protein